MPDLVMHKEAVPAIPELRLVARAQNAPEGFHQHLVPHYHECMEIAYLRRGSLQWWANHEWSDLRGGDGYVTWPGEPHGGTLGKLVGCSLYWLQIRLPEAPGRRRFLGLPDREAIALESSLAHLPRRHFPVPDVADMFDEIIGRLPVEGELSSARVRADLVTLLLTMIEAAGESRQAMSQVTSDAITFMRMWIDRPLDMAAVARASGRSISHFKYRFRMDMGIGPAEYHLRLRIKEAQRRLRTTKESITHMAVDLGFNSSQYFATAFARLVGMSPSKYREALEPDPSPTAEGALLCEWPFI